MRVVRPDTFWRGGEDSLTGCHCAAHSCQPLVLCCVAFELFLIPLLHVRSPAAPQALLSATIIDDGVQVAGCVVTVASVTLYMGYL